MSPFTTLLIRLLFLSSGYGHSGRLLQQCAALPGGLRQGWIQRASSQGDPHTAPSPRLPSGLLDVLPADGRRGQHQAVAAVRWGWQERRRGRKRERVGKNQSHVMRVLGVGRGREGNINTNPWLPSDCVGKSWGGGRGWGRTKVISSACIFFYRFSNSVDLPWNSVVQWSFIW